MGRTRRPIRFLSNHRLHLCLLGSLRLCDLLDLLQVGLDHLVRLHHHLLQLWVLRRLRLLLELAVVVLVVLHHALDVGLIKRIPGEPLHLVHVLHLALGRPLRNLHAHLLGHRLQLLHHLAVVIHHALGKLLHLVVAALLERQLTHLDLGHVAFQRFFQKCLVHLRTGGRASHVAHPLLLLSLHFGGGRTAGLTWLLHSAAARRLREHWAATERRHRYHIPHSYCVHSQSPC